MKIVGYFSEVYIVRIKEPDFPWSLHAICYGEWQKQKMQDELSDQKKTEENFDYSIETLGNTPAAIERLGSL